MRILNKRWLFPLKLGIIYGLIAGFFKVSWIINYYDYFHYQLYNTAFKILVPEINRCVIVGSAVFYAVWLVFLIGSKLKGFVRRAYSFVFATVAIIYAFKCDFLIEKLRSIKYLLFQTSLFQIVYEQAKWQLLVSVAIILCAVCFLVIKHFRVKAQNKEIVENTRYTAFYSTISSHILGIERSYWLSIPVFTLILGLNFALGFFWCRPTLAKRSKPNVIVIMVDTLRADHVGCYGYKRNTTPYIDQFAKNSTRFTNAVANSSWTTASVSSFMTSQLPQTTLAVSFGDKVMPAITMDSDMAISPRCVTMAQLLSDNEYKTAAVISNPQYSFKRNAWQGFNYFDDSNMVDEITSPGTLSTTKKWIAQNQDKPFFLFTLFMDTHSPYHRFPGFDFDPGYKGKDANKVVIRLPYSSNTSTAKHMIDLYDSGVAYSDHTVGLLLNDLKKRGLYDSSLIIILSDHGEEFRDHGNLFHGDTLYKEVVNVPLIIKMPFQKKGKVIDGKFPLIDLLPTVLKAVDIDSIPAYLQGEPVDINNTNKIENKYIYAQTNLGLVDIRSIQNNNFKLIMDMKSKKVQMYDLNKDSPEKHNIISGNRKTADELRKLLVNEEKKAVLNCNLLAGVTQVRRETLMRDMRKQYKEISVKNHICRQFVKKNIKTDWVHPLKMNTKTVKPDKNTLADKMRSLGYMQ